MISLLPSTESNWRHYGKGIYPFSSSDSIELFNQNILKCPKDWRWKTETIDYDINSHGYRCPEFDTIDWENSHIMIGCSRTFGVGCPEQETIPALLSERLGEPVINLGMGGTGCDYAFFNAMRLQNIKFKKLFLLWPDIGRFFTFVDTKQKIKKYLAKDIVDWFLENGSNLNQNPVLDRYNGEYHQQLMFEEYHSIVKGTFQEKYISLDWDERSELKTLPSAKIGNLGKNDWQLKGRDLIHDCGIHNKYIVDYIMENKYV